MGGTHRAGVREEGREQGISHPSPQLPLVFWQQVSVLCGSSSSLDDPSSFGTASSIAPSPTGQGWFLASGPPSLSL